MKYANTPNLVAMRKSVAALRRMRVEPDQVDGAVWIHLDKGRFSLIDSAMSDLRAITWSCTNWGYAQEYLTRRYLHRMVHGRTLGRELYPYEYVDHINGDKLDNRSANLRLATTAQNAMNVGIRSNNRSGYKGVSWAEHRQKWFVCITFDGKTFNVGRYDDLSEAAWMWDQWAIELHGEFARLNFDYQ